MRAAGYARVSTRKQASDGLSLAEQKATLATECERQGWKLATVVVEAKSGKQMAGRDLELLLAQLDRGEYDCLIVTHMDRIARSLLDFLIVLQRAEKHGWAVRMMYPNVDTTDPFGKAMAQMAGSFAELQGALISQKTREGLAYARAQGTFRPGEHLRYRDESVIRRIMRWHEQGLSAPKIIERLDRESIRPPQGDVWYPKTVNRIIKREKKACT